MVCALLGTAGLAGLIFGTGYAGLIGFGFGALIVGTLAGTIYLGTRPGTSLSKASTQARDRQIKSLKKRELGFQTQKIQENEKFACAGNLDKRKVRVSWDTRPESTFQFHPSWEPELPDDWPLESSDTLLHHDMRIEVELKDKQIAALEGLTSVNTGGDDAGFDGSVWEDRHLQRRPIPVGDQLALDTDVEAEGFPAAWLGKVMGWGAAQIGDDEDSNFFRGACGFRFTIAEDRLILDSRLSADRYSVDDIKKAVAFVPKFEKYLAKIISLAFEDDTRIPDNLVVQLACRDQGEAATKALERVVFSSWDTESPHVSTALRTLARRRGIESLRSQLTQRCTRAKVPTTFLKSVVGLGGLDEEGLLTCLGSTDRSPNNGVRPNEQILLNALARVGESDSLEQLGIISARHGEQASEDWKTTYEFIRTTILDRIGDRQRGGLTLAQVQGGGLTVSESTGGGLSTAITEGPGDALDGLRQRDEEEQDSKIQQQPEEN